MIYLIDDKKDRQQQDYNWTKARFSKHSNIELIHTLEELERKRKKIFNTNNTILYHESFLSNTRLDSESSTKRDLLEEYANKNPNFSLVFFSGSKNTRNLDNNIAFLPVSILYQNLEFFLRNYKHHSENNLKFLLFGKNPTIEEELLSIRDKELIKIYDEDKCSTEKSILFFETEDKKIKNPIMSSNLKKEDLYDDEIHDGDFSNIITNSLNEKKYENIFIPLCFGYTLSDFNGLRLATHIRCTQTLNQLSNIFIYGFVGIEYIIENKYFDILKTKNITLLPYSKKKFAEEVEKHRDPLTKEELIKEIAKLKLEPTEGYIDSHSIANEWGIYQMARNGNIDIKTIEGFEYEKFESIYFKWLITKNNLDAPLSEKQVEQQQKYSHEIELKIIGKIDVTKIPKR